VSRSIVMTSPRDSLEDKVNKELAERVGRFRKALEGGLENLTSHLFLRSADDVHAGEATLGPLRGFLESTAHATTQKAVLSALLDCATACYPRIILFVPKSGSLVPWSARNAGDSSRHNEEAYSAIPATGEHLGARALLTRNLATAGPEGPGAVLSAVLGGPVPARSAAVPLMVRGRAAAVLYGDTPREDAPGLQTLFAVLAQVAGIKIEILDATRRLATVGHAGTDRSKGMQQASGAGGKGRASSIPPDLEGDDAALHLDGDGPDASGPADLPSPQAPEAAEMDVLLGNADSPLRETAEEDLDEDDRRSHADARRFASLLVSEILLYNEEAVILGRRHHDIARRLAKEIDKSRQIFDARVPHDPRGVGRYFDEELVRLLAGGDPSALGS
jgi:hypothetical protein